jgi:hypothetical protein
VPIVLKFGNFSLLETSGFVQAFNGIALPFTGERKTLDPFAISI